MPMLECHASGVVPPRFVHGYGWGETQYRWPTARFCGRVPLHLAERVPRANRQHAYQKIVQLLLCVSFRSEEHTSELQSRENLVCRLLLEKKKYLLKAYKQ